MAFQIITKYCNSCKTDKGLDSFYKHRSHSDGLTSSCKSCSALSQKKRYERNKDIEHGIYVSAKARCQSPSHCSFERYGNRGIEFRFESFEEFLEELGHRPTPNHSIERINNEGHYEKGNVRWATAKEQANNRRSSRYITAFGETKTHAEWADILGVHRHFFAYRLSQGWCSECAITIPKYKGCCSHINKTTD